MSNYVSKKEQDAIKKFMSTEISERERTELFDTFIHPAFRKLSEHWIRRFNQRQEDIYGDLKNDCISHLIAQLEKYNTDKNPFSWFNVIARNYILQRIGKKKPYVTLTAAFRKDSNEMLDGVDENNLRSEGILDERFVDVSYSKFGEVEEESYSKFLQKFLAKKLAICEDKQEYTFINAMITIIELKDDLLISNKKLLYSMIRELTGFQSRDVTKYLGQLRQEEPELRAKYFRIHG